MTDNRLHNVRIVIIGAGLAGLAAAQKIHQNGFSNIVILEAQDRVGGRIHTIDHSDFIIELGAQWLHGSEDNPLYAWMLDKNLLEDPEEADSEMSGAFCSNGGKLVEPELVEKVFEITTRSKRNLSKNVYQDLVKQNGFKMASDVFRHELDKAVARDNYLARNKNLVYPLFDWFLRYETIDNCCNSMNEVSINSYTGWSDWGDGTLINFKGGYSSLVKWFTDIIPTSSVELCKSVTKIALKQKQAHDTDGSLMEKSIVIDYEDISNRDSTNSSDNNSRTHRLSCDHVIFTGSLGFLKENHKNLFEPPLSKTKQKLINSIGFGTVNKIFLQFQEPFWGDHLGIKLVWTQQDRDEGRYPDWVYDITGFDSVRRQPNLLLGWIGGQGAKSMEQETNQSIASVCINILNRFWPADFKSPSKLVSCICSRWNSNPYIRGSYSFQSMESFQHELDDLHEPVYDCYCPKEDTGQLNGVNSPIPRIMFAGEATSGNLYSTTHGAITSGWREADRLLDLYGSSSW